MDKELENKCDELISNMEFAKNALSIFVICFISSLAFIIYMV